MKGRLPLGPFDPAWGEPLLLEVELEGGVVTGAGLETGLGYRGIERAIEGAPLERALEIVSRMCARSSVAHGFAFCRAVEDACGTRVQESPSALRVLLAEYERIAAHLGAVSRLGRALEDDIIYRGPRRYAAAVREAFRGACGDPFGFGAVVPGGVRLPGDPDAFGSLPAMFRPMGRDIGLWEKKLALSRGRLAGAVLGGRSADEDKAPSPAFRASGSRSDLRSRENAYDFYGKLDYDPVTREGGSSLDRVLVLLGEVRSSAALIERTIAEVDAGPGVTESFEFKKASGVGYCESPHGAIEHRVFLGSGGKLIRDRMSCAAEVVGDAMTEALRGTRHEDLLGAVVSFCVCASCIDR